MPDLIDPTDDREADRFADELIAITDAQRAVVEAAMALSSEWEDWLRLRGYAVDVIGDVALQNVIVACRALRLTRKVLA